MSFYDGILSLSGNGEDELGKYLICVVVIFELRRNLYLVHNDLSDCICFLKLTLLSNGHILELVESGSE